MKREYIHVSRQSVILYRYICRYDSSLKTKEFSSNFLFESTMQHFLHVIALNVSYSDRYSYW